MCTYMEHLWNPRPRHPCPMTPDQDFPTCPIRSFHHFSREYRETWMPSPWRQLWRGKGVEEWKNSLLDFLLVHIGLRGLSVHSEKHWTKRHNTMDKKWGPMSDRQHQDSVKERNKDHWHQLCWPLSFLFNVQRAVLIYTRHRDKNII